MGRGRPRKPTQLHMVEGTLRPVRHADRELEPQPGGTPRMPADLSGEARKFWKRVVPQLIQTGVAKSADRESLEQMARLWGYWKAAAAQADVDPLDRNTRNSVLRYVSEWQRIAAKFGLTPADRSKIVVAPADSADTTEKRYFG